MVDTPVRQRYRRIPPSEYELVKIYIGQLLDTQVIWESCSPYTSLVILVKKDGSLCMCVEYCELNSKTWKDAFTLPRIEETLYSLTGACWFTSLDLASWYSHVPVAESDHHKTVFVHLFGCLNRIACPSAWAMHQLLSNAWWSGSLVTSAISLSYYLDDVIVFSSSVQQHLQRLRMVLRRLRAAGLKVKLE